MYMKSTLEWRWKLTECRGFQRDYVFRKEQGGAFHALQPPVAALSLQGGRRQEEK